MAKGFNRGPAAGGQAGMLQQLQRMQKQMEEAKEKLAQETVTATAGGGAVKVIMTGDQKCKSVEISAEFIRETDTEMLQDMVLSAVNLALDQTRELQQKLMGPLAGGLP